MTPTHDVTGHAQHAMGVQGAVPLVQPELPVRTDAPLGMIKEDHPNVDWLVRLLAGRDWTPSEEVLRAAGKPVNEYGRRWVRRLAQRSKGRVLGQPGQSGYKLTTGCTQEEYNHWRNAMKSQSDEMLLRIISADKVWYTRAAVSPSHGILESGSSRREETLISSPSEPSEPRSSRGNETAPALDYAI